MRSMRKEDMDKAAWSWADCTEPKFVTQQHVELAYRIKFDVCSPNSCRRNCRGNPRCLSGLGESKWLGPKAAAAAEDAWGVDMVDPNEERREIGTYVGLKNLGATCYVNSLLQLWFHNLKFRHAMYSWSPEEDPQEMANQTLNKIEGKEYVPESSVGHLQLLFALLHFGKRRYVDPTAFILSLGLDTTTQQDAQEFSKLFISMLEERLSHQSSALVKNVINEQFCGKYSYGTKCQQCGTESALPSMFYELELNIAGHKTLADCLEEFLKEERLEGADRYHCTVCKSKQDATRSIKLDILPPVLNLQLMRFVFDRQKGCKKKLNSYLQFPENLDMSMYLGKPTGSLVYVLSAVLIHRGHSAYSGHYVAHICDSTTSTWYKFNDEAVEKMEGKKLKLGSEEDSDDGNKKNKPQRVPKGFLTSNNAYMLVYTQAKQAEQQNNAEKKSSEAGNKTSMEWILPERLSDLVRTEDQKFEDWVKEMNETKAVTVESGKARQQEMANLYNMLPVTEGAPYEFITSDWLVKWLSSDDVKAVDNSDIVCVHGKLDPGSVPLTKCISSAAADLLYAKFGGGPRLCGDASKCLPCVKHRCKVIRLKTKTAEDSKKVTSLLKTKIESAEATFWVGKNSLRCWRKLALDEVEGVKSECNVEESNGYSMDEVNEKCINNCNNRLMCDSSEKHSDEKMQMVQNGQNMFTECCKDYIGDRIKSESSSVLLNSEDCESATQRTTYTRSKSDDLESRATKSSPLLSCSNSTNNSPVSCSSKNCVKDDSQGLRRTFLSKSMIGNSESETMEMEVSSTVSTECEKIQNVNLVSSDACNDGVVTSSDEILVSGTWGDGKNFSKFSGEITSLQDSEKAEVEVMKKHSIGSNRNVSVNGTSQTCTDSTVKTLQPRPSYIRIRTPGFGDDIIQSIEEVVKCRQLGQKSVIHPEEFVNNTEKTVMEEKESFEEKTISDVTNVEEYSEQLMSFSMTDSQKPEDDDEQEDEEGFNEDILCEHGNLCVEEGQRRLVSQEVWNILRSYFPSARSFSYEAKPCICCQNLATQGKATRDMYRQTAALQKDSLMDLYYDRNRIAFGSSASLQRQKQPTNNQVLHLVSRDFVDSWRRFVRDPTRKDPESFIVNGPLLCPHGGLLYDPASSDNSSSSTRFVVVTESEWSTLCNFYSVDHDILVRRDLNSNTIVSQPDICEECVMARLKTEEMELLQYEKAKIFVRKVAVSDNNNGQLHDAGSGSTSTQSEYKDDPEYQGSDAKRPKLSTAACSSPTPGGMSSDTRVRKSTRHRRMRGEKELIVSSKLTLLELKVMVMKLFHVAPFDQHLSVDGRDLMDNNATLGSLQVYPDSIVLLKADEPCDDPSLMDEYMKNTTIEEGFKGTELLK